MIYQELHTKAIRTTFMAHRNFSLNEMNRHSLVETVLVNKSGLLNCINLHGINYLYITSYN